jgi:H+/Cl- antiporter ClcA
MHPEAAPRESTGPTELLRSRRYVGLLLLAAVLGVPISAVAYGFLFLVNHVQQWVYDDLPSSVGFPAAPTWWPIPVLLVSGFLTGLAIRWLPGRGGHSPAGGFKPGLPEPVELPGVAAAALAGLGLGVVLGPEAPLIAIGGGLAVWAVRLSRRDLPHQAMAVVGAAGAFAAISTLLGSPLVGAFLLMEMAGIAGPMLGVVMVPGLLAAGVGSLIFIGLGQWTGLGTFSLAIPDLAAVAAPDLPQFGWAIVIGIAAALLGTGLRRGALAIQKRAERRVVTYATVAGGGIALLAVAYAAATGRGPQDVLFSGQDALGPLLTQNQTYAVGTLLLLIVGKGAAYAFALATFRGGPIFPSMFIGAAGGIALAHLPGLDPIQGAAMGIGAMCTVLLKFPLTAVLLTTLFLGADGITVMPLAIVAVVVAYVASAWLSRPSTAPRAPD